MSETTSHPARRGLPLYVRILIGVALGTLVGLFWPRNNAWLEQRGLTASLLSDIGILVITLLKTLATPLILFAVLDAFLRTRIPARKGLKMVALSLLNATVAILIGLSVANLLHTGERWQGQLAPIKQEIERNASGKSKKEVDEDQERVEGLIDTLTAKKILTKEEAKPKPPSLSLKDNLARYTPKNIIDPFRKNSVITVVLLAVLAGAALRKIKDRYTTDSKENGEALSPQNEPFASEMAAGIRTLEGTVRVIFQMFAQMLDWIMQIIPFAVFGIVAGVVSKTGLGVFKILGIFLGTVALGLFLHAVVYYSLLLRTLGKTSPRQFFTGGLEAIITALSVGSSLATLPVTLRCLNDRLKVSPDSARLAACVGTNLNHDGIILYEAAAVLFVAQAFGIHLSLAQQVTIALASVMAGIGIAGVPEAGLITLPLVLGAAGIPDAVALTVIPLILPVDWIIGRLRACVNVLSDMTVAILLDRLHPTMPTEPEPSELVSSAPVG